MLIFTGPEVTPQVPYGSTVPEAGVPYSGVPGNMPLGMGVVPVYPGTQQSVPEVHGTAGQPIQLVTQMQGQEVANAGAPGVVYIPNTQISHPVQGLPTTPGSEGRGFPVADPVTPTLAGSGLNALNISAPLSQSLIQPMMVSTPAQQAGMPQGI